MSAENLTEEKVSKAEQPDEDKSEDSTESSIETNLQGIERLIALYEQRVAVLQRDTNSKFSEAVRIAELIEEPNILSVYQLVEIFGATLAAEKAAEAWTLFQEAKNRGSEAYVKSETGTAVATKKGQPRTPGGIFFYLMRQYSDSLGLHWSGLHLPKLPGPIAHLRPKLKARALPSDQPNGQPTDQPSGTKQTATATPAAEKLTTSQNKAAPASVKSAKNPPQAAAAVAPKPKAKPARANLKVVGPLLNKPKHQPNNQVGIVELVIKAEMNTALPKGLPNLGNTRIVVWCTEKQFNKIKNTLTAESRFVIEGEPSAAVGADLQPFLRVICLKLTTIELEQALREAQSQSSS
ncbi:MAG: hypothetical protein WCS37_01920 [Chloroflexota bacterium]|nr:hypothetical protein [Chloroflexota bacterium]